MIILLAAVLVIVGILLLILSALLSPGIGVIIACLGLYTVSKLFGERRY